MNPDNDVPFSASVHQNTLNHLDHVKEGRYILAMRILQSRFVSLDDDEIAAIEEAIRDRYQKESK